MALPAAYTESTLAAFQHAELGSMAGVLGWTVADGDYDEAVNDTLVLYGTDDLSSVTGRDSLGKLRRLARVAVWRRAQAALANLHDFSADGGSYSLNQLYQQAALQVRAMEALAAADLPEYAIQVRAVDYENDPYDDRPYDERIR